MFKKKRLLHQLGTTLIEILLATAILGLVMTGIVSIITLSVKNTADSKARSIAIKYAQEATEFFRQQKQILGWESFVASFPGSGVATYCVATIPSDLANLQTGNCTASQFVDAKGIFQRQAQVSVTQTTRDGQPVTDVNVTMTVTWTDGNNNKQSTVFQKFEDAVVGYVPPTTFPQPSGPAWRYRQQISIANTASAQTDFQVQLTLDTLSLSGAGKMLSNCDDIRLTDTNGVLLSYWIEPGTCNTSASKIWLKVPSVPAGGTTVFLYYGNPVAVSGSASVTSIFIREIANLIAAWNLDETSGSTFADSSGYSHTMTASLGTAGNTSLPAAHVAGKFNNGVSFDGADDTLTNTDNLGLTTANITMSCWVYLGSASLRGPCLKIGQSTGGYGLGVGSINYDTLGNNFVLLYEYVRWINSSSTIGTRWHHLALVINSSGVPLAYKDGQYLNQFPGSTAITPPVWTTYIGGYTSIWESVPYPRYLNALIDDVYVYNRALTTDEVAAVVGTAGSNQGYATANYPGKVLVRKFSAAVTVGTVGAEEGGWYPL